MIHLRFMGIKRSLTRPLCLTSCLWSSIIQDVEARKPQRFNSSLTWKFFKRFSVIRWHYISRHKLALIRRWRHLQKEGRSSNKANTYSRYDLHYHCTETTKIVRIVKIFLEDSLKWMTASLFYVILYYFLVRKNIK